MPKSKNLESKLDHAPAPLVPGTLITDKTAAAALSISRSHFWDYLVKQKKLNPVKLSPRTTRFRTDDVLALMAA